MKRRGHLIERIVEYGSLLAASNRARRGKRDRIDVAHFVFHLEHNLLALQAELRLGPTADSLFRWGEFVVVAVPEHRARGVLRTEICSLRAGDWLPFE